MDICDTNTFCIIPWIYMRVAANGNVQPCCVADHSIPVGNINDNSFEEIYNSEKMKELRRDMLAGRQNGICKLCYNRELANNHSARLWENQRWNHKFYIVGSTQSDGYVPEFNSAGIELMLSNKCNLRCVMCYATRSSAWINDAIAMFGASENKYNNSKNELNYILNHIDVILPELEEVYFSGGEPLMIDEHYAILDKLIERGRTDIRLRYNSNMSTLRYKGRYIIDIWDKFEDVYIGASLDGTGKRGEYIRKGLNYNKFIENVKTVKNECCHVRVDIQCVLQIMNVFHIPDMHKELFNEGVVRQNSLVVTPVIWPHQLRYEIINERMYDSLMQMYYDEYYPFLDKNKIDMTELKLALASYSHLPYRDDFFEFTNKLDKVRNTNYLDVCPELKDL